jgi:hypothetical protein
MNYERHFDMTSLSLYSLLAILFHGFIYANVTENVAEIAACRFHAFLKQTEGEKG